MEFSCIVFLFSLLTNACFITKTRPDLIPDLGMGRALVQKEAAKLLSIGNADALGGGGGGGGGSDVCLLCQSWERGNGKEGQKYEKHPGSKRCQRPFGCRRLGAAAHAVGFQHSP